MHGTRSAPALLFFLIALAVPACADGGTPPAHASEPLSGLNIRLDLSGGPAIHSFQPSKDAEAVVVTLVSDRDVDLFVYASQADLDSDSPLYSGESRHNVECARIEIDADGPLLIKALDPGTPAPGASAFLAMVEEREGPAFLLADQAERFTLEPGVEEAVYRLLLPDGLEFAAVRAECSNGRPGLELRREEVVRHGRSAGEAAEVLLDGTNGLFAGVFEVNLTRPPEVPKDERLTVDLEASLATGVPSVERQEAGAILPLPGRSGSLTLYVDEDDSTCCCIDLKAGAGSIRLATDADDGDFDIYVSRRAPALGNDDWGWASWRLGPDEDLTVGGAGRLPADRYFVMIEHHSGEDARVSLTWEIRDAEAPLEVGEMLDDGADTPVEFGPDECFSWWPLPANCRSGAHLQVLFSDKRVELAVARRDTGEVILRTDDARKAPYFRFDASELVAGGTDLLVSAYRWTMDEPVTAGRLFLGTTERPLPGADYFPPYPSFTDSPRDRMLAATVELSGEDGGGTGVLVSPTGLLLTCEHVVEGEEEMLVNVPTGERGRPRELYRAVTLFADATLDLALLRIIGDAFDRDLMRDRPLPFVPMGGLGSMRLGDPVTVPGYPTSASSAFESNLVLTRGVLSGVEVERDEPRWLISDGRYADGNSGSGLFDPSGVVRGIHSMMVGPDSGSLGYARPLDALPAAWKARILREGGKWVAE